MTSDWTRHSRRECVGSEVRLELPVRPLGMGRWIGFVLTGFGLMFIWRPAQGVWQAAQKWFEQPPGGVETFFALVQLLFVLAGLLPMGLGLLLLLGRCRVEWKDGRLQATEILGPLHWHRRLPPNPIRRLEVSGVQSQHGSAAPQAWNRFSALTALFEDGSRKLVVLGYPQDWLLGLAQELSGYLSSNAAHGAAAAVEVVETSPTPAGADEVLEQPAGSRVQLEEHAAGLRLAVPPAGIGRGAKGLFFFGLVWCAFMVVFTVGMASAVVRKDAVEWALVAFLVGFWAIGLGMVGAAIHLGRRTATLAVEGGRLQVETRGLFGTKRREWHHSELAAIRADASGMEVGGRPVIELQFHPRAGKKVGLLAGRNEDELRWMATRLRAALRVPARQSPN